MQALHSRANIAAAKTSNTWRLLVTFIQRGIAEFKEMSGYFLLAVILVMLEGLRTRGSRPKPLETPLGVHNLSGWSITHFTLFTIIGWMFPHNGVTAITLGILWESLEWMLGYLSKMIGGDEKFWYSRFSDIIVNTAGFIFGASLNSVFVSDDDG